MAKGLKTLINGLPCVNLIGPLGWNPRDPFERLVWTLGDLAECRNQELSNNKNVLYSSPTYYFTVHLSLFPVFFCEVDCTVRCQPELEHTIHWRVDVERKNEVQLNS